MTVKIILTDDECLNKEIIEKIKDQNVEIVKNEDLKDDDQEKGVVVNLQKNMTADQNVKIIQVCQKAQENKSISKVAIISGVGIGMGF